MQPYLVYALNGSLGSHHWITASGIPALFRPVDADLNELVIPLYEEWPDENFLMSASPEHPNDGRNLISGFKVYNPAAISPSTPADNISDDFRLLPAVFYGLALGYDLSGDYAFNVSDVVMVLPGEVPSGADVTLSSVSVTGFWGTGTTAIPTPSEVDMVASAVPLYQPSGELILDRFALYIQHRGQSIPNTVGGSLCNAVQLKAECAISGGILAIDILTHLVMN